MVAEQNVPVPLSFYLLSSRSSMPILAPVLPGSKSMSVQRLFHPRTRVRFAQFGYEIRQFRLPHEGLVEYAQWQHPYDMPKTMTQPAVDAVRQFVSPGDFVIDIGAHSGDTTVPMALAAGPAGCTLALEPNPYVYKILVANAALNRQKTNIVPCCCAATEHDGNFVFHYSDAAFCNGGFRSQQRWPIFRRKHALTVAGRNLLQMLQTEFANWLPKLRISKSTPRATTARSSHRYSRFCTNGGPSYAQKCFASWSRPNAMPCSASWQMPVTDCIASATKPNPSANH